MAKGVNIRNMEPQNENSAQPEQTAPTAPAVSPPVTQSTQATEAEKPVVVESPIIISWKRPIITMLIIGVAAIALMLLAKNL